MTSVARTRPPLTRTRKRLSINGDTAPENAWSRAIDQQENITEQKIDKAPRRYRSIIHAECR